MPRKTAYANSSLRLPVVLAALVTFGTVNAYAAGVPSAEDIQTMSAAQQQAAQAQVTNYPPIPTTGATETNTAAPGTIMGYDPTTGAPIFAPTQTEEDKPKVKQVLYEDTAEAGAVDGTDEVPPDMKTLQNVERENKIIDGESTGMPLDIRRDAIKEAAISFGARGGLAWRTYQIRRELDTRARELDKIYDFSQLLIPAPSGLLIEPPVISESMNAMLIESDGQQAAVSDRIYNIVNNAKIVSTARTWRNYLEREWGVVDPPPDILRPENDEERKLWKDLVEQGWAEGVKQADEIFQDDLNVLMADFQGMVRYRVLLTQGMVSPPYALQVDRGVTGDGKEMRIGDRAVQITGKPELITGSDQWQPANR
jgi:defect-in-organelle-trafficking protein DotC